jgi:hypothetical protein
MVVVHSGEFWKGWDESTMHVHIFILVFVKWLCWLISLIYIQLTSEKIIRGKGQKHADGASVGGQNKECRKFITFEQKLDVLKWY